MKNLQKTHLRLAFEWTCPNCGIDYFERAMTPDLGDGELVELQSEHGVEPWNIGEFMMAPTKVTCRECKQVFETEQGVD